MYQLLFGASLEAQNDRYRKKGNYDRVKTIDDYRSSPRTCPEEIIMMIGTKDDEIPRSVLTRAMNVWLSEMQTRYGSNVHLLDIAVHVDEPGGIHAHVRWVYSKTGKDGREVSQRGALAELGIERPDSTKPENQYNNAKMAFTEKARALWLESIERSGGPDIIDVCMFHSIDLLISVLNQHSNLARCLCIKTWVPSDPDDPKIRRVRIDDYYLYLTPVPYDGGEIAYEMTAVHIPSGYRWMVQHEVSSTLEKSSLGQLYELIK